MRCHHQCGRVRSTCTLNARCAPRNRWCDVVIGVLAVHCELHDVVRVHLPLVVCDLFSSLFIVGFVSVVAIFQKNIAVWEKNSLQF